VLEVDVGALGAPKGVLAAHVPGMCGHPTVWQVLRRRLMILWHLDHRWHQLLLLILWRLHRRDWLLLLMLWRLHRRDRLLLLLVLLLASIWQNWLALMATWWLLLLLILVRVWIVILYVIV
jgi:hypothetical protein